MGDGPRRPDSRALTKRSWRWDGRSSRTSLMRRLRRRQRQENRVPAQQVHGPGSRSAFRRRSRLPTRSRGRQRHEACDSPKQVVLQSFACLHGWMQTIECSGLRKRRAGFGWIGRAQMGESVLKWSSASRRGASHRFCVLPSMGFTTTRAKTGLLVAQGHHGIDFAGAARGNIASGERDQRKQDRDSGEG